MPEQFDDKLVIAISSRALFNLDDSHQVYEGYCQVKILRSSLPGIGRIDTDKCLREMDILRQRYP